ncbi:MAG: TIGR03905 family TSCPD domain-containing protein [Clostridia bacterium]
MKVEYKTRGVCARLIEFDIEDGCVYNVVFHGGCNGNLKGIASLVDGMPCEQVVAKLKGVTCGSKFTSCPNELASAIESNF